jgi:hypothetical protein
MAAIWVRARAELRQRWRATVVLMAVAGLAGGAVMATVAGARRTDSAMDRFLAYNRPLIVSVAGPDFNAVRRLPQVADADEGAFVLLTPSTPSGAPDPGAMGSIGPLATVHGRILVTSERPLLVHGRLPNPARPLEVRLDPASDRRRAIMQLQHDFPNTVLFPLKQPDITNLERVGYLPGLLASLVALLALGTTAHALITSVRRRRRDLAILKTLGFVRGQISQTVAWQATTFALVAGLIGVPLGVAGGRWAWRLVAEQLGVASGPIVPPVSVLTIVTGALVVANLVAAGPGWTAARIQPSVVLRAE